MINNPTPEEKAWWDKQMDRHLKDRVASPARAAAIIFAFISLVAGVATYHQVRYQPPGPSIGQQLNDTLFRDHSEILDTATFSTRATRRKEVDSLVASRSEEDSIVFRNNNISLMMYHGEKVVAMRPNKTWHWLVLDSTGYKIAIVKAKRRDSL